MKVKRLRMSGMVLFALASFGLAAQEPGARPLAVSPGDDSRVADIWQSCPTFSWSAVAGASSYRVAVFAAEAGAGTYEEMAGTGAPLVLQEIAGPALSWTLPTEQALASGGAYAWYVEALDAFGQSVAGWSAGKSFRVKQEIRLVGVTEKLEEILKGHGVSDLTATSVIADLRSAVKEVPLRNSVSGIVSGTGSGRGRNLGSEGADSTFYGTGAGHSNSSDDNENSFFGSLVGYNTTTGGGNAMMGVNAGYLNVTGSLNTFLGTEAGNCFTADGNTFVGNEAGYGSLGASTGSDNTFVGNASGYSATSGYRNVFFGYQAGYNNTTGYHNTYLGMNTGYNNLTGYRNVFIGSAAGFGETGSEKLYIDNSSTSSPLIYGDFALDLLRVNGRLQVTGPLSLDNGVTQISASELNLLDGKTLALGAAGNDQLATKGYVDENDAVGLTGAGLTSAAITKWNGSQLANSLLTEGTGSVSLSGKLGIGTSAPAYPIEIDTTGANAEFIVKRTDGATFKVSAMAKSGQFGTISNNPLNFMANNVKVMTLTQQSRVGIGVTQPLYPIHMASGAYCSAGGVWTNASSRALKENIADLDAGAAEKTLEGLNPVTFTYKADKRDRHVGFIAEDVPELVASSDRKGLSPMDIVAVLTKVVQEQQRTIATLQERLKTVSELEKRVAELEKRK